MQLEANRGAAKGKTIVKLMDEYEDQVAEEQLYKVRLFQFPDCVTSSAIFDEEDLESDALLVLCANSKPDDDNRQQDTVYVWHGADHSVSKDQIGNFVDQCIQKYYGAASENINVV